MKFFWSLEFGVWSFCFLLPFLTLGSPSTALREYKSGQYDQSLKEYERLLQQKGDDPRLHFNAGVAAYRKKSFHAALEHFEYAIKSPDLNLQGQAYYNHGNAQYSLGEGLKEKWSQTRSDQTSQEIQDLWKKAIQDFESSLKLAPADADAKLNREFVKARLEQFINEVAQSKQDQSAGGQDPAKGGGQRVGMAVKAAVEDRVKQGRFFEALQLLSAAAQTNSAIMEQNKDLIERLEKITRVESSTR